MLRKLPPALTEIARLTGAGKLGEATALIQRHLQGGLQGDGLRDDGPAAGRAAPGTRQRRTGLGDTLRDLAARAKSGGFGLPGNGPAVSVPDGASFTTGSYSGPAGTRGYKLYIPANRNVQPLPLIVMLHGCTQSPDDFAAGTGMNALAEEFGCLVVYPEQPSSANPQKCWNWFRPEDQRRDQGEPSLLAGITRQILRDHPADPTRVYIAGLSAGGAAAAVMGAAYPDLYAAVGVHSGLPVGIAADVPSAFAAMRQGAPATLPPVRPIPTIVFHGDQDRTVHPNNADAVAAQVTASVSGLRVTVQDGQTGGGRAYRRTLHSDAADRILCERWTVLGGGHTWMGGSPSGSHTDPGGPDASREMLRFFLTHRLGESVS
ncbi:extracellular catalytic domain type 1 short-chain-length polyhydroxyalkanoate depolymerase [Azospirillum agricola]|uniref:extracellular catalytic domain type 1 short-chain-length polyhydroxyalkanoate depolymerase n=1 Tax=Azospirillum agricola TaxID=1720247 RepID=UPI000A0F3A19|nr:PHB depolymerase family esterase [Azospirillum agricola]SMH31428.1 esterase, PHB depolymerase family [Azospirillum lipoferum]